MLSNEWFFHGFWCFTGVFFRQREDFGDGHPAVTEKNHLNILETKYMVSPKTPLRANQPNPRRFKTPQV